VSTLAKLPAQCYVIPYHVALIHHFLGDKEKTLLSLEEAFEQRDLWLVWIGVEPAFDNLRPDTRFEQGNFSLNVLKGRPGELFAAVTLNPKQFKNCPARLRVSGGISLDRRTDTIQIQADRGIDGVELKLPFPSCKGEKI
jgi:hypothetical protein